MSEITHDQYTKRIPNPIHWQPISTAPRDSTPVLIFSPVDEVVIAHFQPNRGNQGEWILHNAPEGTSNDIIFPPTHWAPISPPTTKEPTPLQIAHEQLQVRMLITILCVAAEDALACCAETRSGLLLRIRQILDGNYLGD